MKRKLLFVSVVAILVASIAGGTLAYFTAEGKAHNVITSGGVEIAVKEWADEEKTVPFRDLDGVMPGMKVTKIAEVKNTGSAAAWVRVKLEKKITLADKTAQSDPGLVILELNTEDWTEKDGYYYYKEAVAPGETTAPLLKSVAFDTKMGNDYQNAKANVDVLAQAVQVANNGKTIWEAKGWPSAD